ncbi:recombinase family protein [Sphingobium indicum]|uniref:Resolvase n=2 Tax=Sphingobium indicum TaxID=332055 RepID=A0A1L5BSW5_SPHIB|nr:recombinase family protein [Sphingobium indicum]APL95979.1 resolvase [Sphingobium indicum B90A]KEZ00052.1 resolvase [Sphingomonas sp. BHC-A]NYI23076.1 DNA invertase Pin-like site-specific DNA recombinase [Sphingobium indicum]RYM01846.1 recombinase family protein [Sphingobium indicum]
MSMIGYARVSTSSQSTDIQVTKLKEAGCSVVRMEKVSGRSREGRSELETIMDFIQAGDTLVVAKLDRLGRSTRDVLNLVHELEERGAALRVLEPAVDTSGPMGKVVLTVLGMVSEMELGFIRERQKDGIEKAKIEGRYKGRPVTLDAAELRRLKEEGLGATEIARRMNCSRSAVYKVLGGSEAAPS